LRADHIPTERGFGRLTVGDRIVDHPEVAARVVVATVDHTVSVGDRCKYSDGADQYDPTAEHGGNRRSKDRFGEHRLISHDV
jgi:hypothetical protein